jgi:hypothetical protein
VLLVGWLVAGSDKDWWQAVVGSLIQVFSLGIVDIALRGPHKVDDGVGIGLGLGLPWSVTQNGAPPQDLQLDPHQDLHYCAMGLAS